MFVSATPDEWDATMRVHLRGHFCVTRHAVDYWRAKQKGGNAPDARIINTTSGAGLQGSIAQAAYSAAKGGIAALTLVQAAELGRYGITANSLAPAARTRMTERAFAQKMATEGEVFDAMDPANIAPTVVWLGSVESAHVTGCVFELELVAVGIAHIASFPQAVRPAQSEPGRFHPAARALPPLLGKGFGGQFLALEGYFGAGQHAPISRRDLVHP
jgi:NAD(P)-dependent dehydrogenase (short-subunit alcohol dehydrogenase family)